MEYLKSFIFLVVLSSNACLAIAQRVKLLYPSRCRQSSTVRKNKPDSFLRQYRFIATFAPPLPHA